MVAYVRVAWRLAACVVSAAVATACTSTPPPSPKLMARRTELYTLWWTYEQDPVFLHTGERARAELAVYRCQNGRYEEGIQELEGLLKHGGFHVESQTP
jgi:hypothetical protein